ncbi:TROVE domain-containing protein [Oleomonas cavernae]|uniref:TROVE domain-containing protein n=1 Tax=Oleomonas cavernae TaxID=2320859 RepID=A0A418WEJ8_9PROT|nr:TROVE domain-containing protein [Oleomonas cavernae]RJF88437.1 TROVE domain-containing protein [Oleomonas cavernae]
MARLNIKSLLAGITAKTHEGALAVPLTPYASLRKAVLSCLLWEDSFYEGGVAIADRIANLVPQVEPARVADLAREARRAFKLRHVPLLLAREMVRHERYRPLVAGVLADVVERPDELAEFLALYWAGSPEGIVKRAPLAAQVKKGLGRAFLKFDEYQLAKYDRDGPIKLVDVLRLTHPKPESEAQALLLAKVKAGSLATPDTWEVALSSGADKRATFERLLGENRLGALALLRNLRLMEKAGVEHDLIETALAAKRVDRVLPFRFVTAARHAPWAEAALEAAMFRATGRLDLALAGHTVLLIDVSGSMGAPIAPRSETTRIDAACGLAVLAREVCDQVEVHTFSNQLVEVASRRGFALRDAVVASQPFAGTLLGKAVAGLERRLRKATRFIVITDEQSHDTVAWPPGVPTWVVNVAPYKPALVRDSATLTRIDGWSEAVLAYVAACEREAA